LCLMWGGVGCSCPIQSFLSHFSFSLALMTAQLQQHSIYNWAQSEHQSAASGTGVVVATRSHIILAARALLPSTSK